MHCPYSNHFINNVYNRISLLYSTTSISSQLLKKINFITLLNFVIVVLIITTTTFSQSKSQFKGSSKVNNAKGKSIVTGIIVDSLTNKPIEFANFVLYRQKDSTLFNGSSTDSTGKFAVLNLPKGNYSAKISVVGYRSRKRNLIEIKNDNSVIELGIIKLIQKSISTNEVQVTADKNKINYENDKIVVNVDRTFGNNAAEVLENTPMVNVDFDGKISLLGRQGTVIYIDGVPAKYSGFEKADDLKLLSSADIEKIEVILNPSVEFSERSDAGIINIITKKKPTTKYSGNTGIDGNTKNQLNSNLGFSYRYKDVFTKVSYSNNYSKYNNNSYINKSITLNNEMNYLEQSANSNNIANRNFITISLGYNIDKSNLLNSGVSFNLRDSENRRFLINQMNGINTNIYDNFESDNLTNVYQKFQNYFVMYNRQFEEKGRSLSALISYFNNSMDMYNSIDKRVLSIANFQKLYNTSGNSNNSLKWTLSYNHPFGKDYKLETGYVGYYKRLAMNNNYSIYDSSEQKYIELLPQRVESKYTDLRQYVYGAFRGLLGEFNYYLGLSIENIKMDNEEITTGNYYSNKFVSLIPSISLSKKIFKDHVLSIGYIRRSNFPENKQLNPHIDYTDSTNIEMGNPNLTPFYTSSYTIEYNVTNKDIFFRAGAAYYNENDIIERITTQQNVHTAVTTYTNLANSKTINAYIYANKRLFNWLQIDPHLGFYNREFNGKNINKRVFNWESGIRSNISISNFKFQMDFNYLSPESDAQSKSNARFYANAAMKVLFFDKQLSITLRTQDIFNTLSQNKNTNGIGFYSTNSLKETTRIISLGISYYFQSKADDSIEQPDDMEKYDDF